MIGDDMMISGPLGAALLERVDEELTVSVTGITFGVG